jgi:hypothetical protein
MTEVASIKDDGYVWTEHRHIMNSKGIVTWVRDDALARNTPGPAVTLDRSGKLHFEGVSNCSVSVLYFIAQRAELLKKAFDDGTLKWKGSEPND